MAEYYGLVWVRNPGCFFKIATLSTITAINTRTELVDGGVRVRFWAGKRKPRARRMYAVTKMLDPCVMFTCVQSSVSVAYHAIMERVKFHKTSSGWERPHQPDPLDIKATFRHFTQLFRQYTFLAAKLAAQEFPERYVGRKKTVYLNALRSLELKPLGEKDARIRSFIKTEKLPYGKKPVVPRVVSPRNPRYNLALGCYIAHLEHAMYDIVAKVFGGRVITKGMTPIQVAQLIRDKWSKFSTPVAVGLDASRFDQHVSKPVLAWEHSLYKMFYRGNDLRQLSWLLQQQLENDCCCDTDDGRIYYTTEGTRCSGDMNTSLGNCLIMCGLFHSYMEQYKPGVSYEFINNGDDCVVIMESGEVLSNICDFYAAAGFVLKVEPPAYVMEHIEFCQSRPVYDGCVWRMVRDPRTSLSKDAITVKPINHADVYPRYLKAVGDAGLSLTAGLPLLQSYYGAMIRQAGDAVALDDPSLDGGLFIAARGMDKGKVREVCREARISFGLAFGCSEATQKRLEQYYDTVDIRYTDGKEGVATLKW